MFRGYFSFQGGENQDVGYLLFLNVKQYIITKHTSTIKKQHVQELYYLIQTYSIKNH